ncbi:MAG: hypothetical protein NTX50_07320 [Candidatus Sumerlaeota bacterium]|nr:hypothetical protein [Candidatus Sumerlaeota bacterium]
MPTVLVACLAFLFLLLMLIGVACGKSRQSSFASLPPGAQVTAQSIQSLSSEEVGRMLSRLEKQSGRYDSMIGASCYIMSPPPDRADYICPVCGEKTLYTSNSAHLIPRLGSFRSKFEALSQRKEAQFALDESSLCMKCRPEAKVRALMLKVTYANGARHEEPLQSVDELQMLKGFLDGLCIYNDSWGNVASLCGQAPRLRALLGIPKQE